MYMCRGVWGCGVWGTLAYTTLLETLSQSEPSSVSMLKGLPLKNMLRVRWFNAGTRDAVPSRTVVRKGSLSHELKGPVAHTCQAWKSYIDVSDGQPET